MPQVTGLATKWRKAVDELLSLQGVWVHVSQEYGGKKLYEEDIRLEPASLLLAGQRYTLKCRGRVLVDEDFRIDSTTSPKLFELVRAWEDGTRWLVQGIYRLDGDLLSICLGEDRPTDFVTRPGLVQSLAVYRRAENLSLHDYRRLP
jgi:uncharacterized protein (TIGR03067 family)